ncbi:hypothetical protein D3C74_493620 [compost metagenome]
MVQTELPLVLPTRMGAVLVQTELLVWPLGRNLRLGQLLLELTALAQGLASQQTLMLLVQAPGSVQLLTD